ncbi:MAG: TonB-dependent receptor [Bacteroidota bacterium]|nr:TonB-dependent receptor [Bacteroidota bacterium]
MKRIHFLLLQIIIFQLLNLPSPVKAQSIIKGTIKDKNGIPITYANVYIKNSTDGSVTDTLGRFSIRTNLKGSQVINVSYIGYEPLTYPVELEDKEYFLNLTLNEKINKLDEIVISAGTIEANNERKVAILKPLDIVTTAGAAADIVSAIQTLPGVQRNEGDRTGLMVRGGDASESLVIVDGIISQNAYFSSVPGVSQRSRFNPFQFKGTTFSSGGYSCRYGQAMSSVLDLQTKDLPDENTISIGVNLTGISISGSKLMDKNAIEFTGTYLNLTPYLAVTKTNFDYYQAPLGGSFSTRWISKAGDRGMFKMDLAESFSKSGITIPNPENFGAKINYGNRNENTFFYMSYYNYLTDKIRYSTAFSFSNNTDNISWGTYPLYRHDSRVQGRGEINYDTGKKLYLIAGTEIQRINYDQQFTDTLSNRFNDTQLAGYIESEWKPVKSFGFKAGVRAEYSGLLGKGNIAPRISVAVKTGESSQVSAAGGLFYQTASPQYLIEGYRPGFQKAVHYILNYQIIKNDRTCRIEAYYKSYSQLIHEKNVAYDPDQYRFYFGMVDNSGSGYAKGIDLFWRDKKTFKNLDYWVSYSYIDTKRLYLNYPVKATPDFVSPHNLNLIIKYFIEKIQADISGSYYYASGRTFYDPNSPEFLADKTPGYHNLSLSLSYLTSIKKMFTVIYLGVDNITNRQNILGYRFSADGVQKYPVVPSTYRSVFFGINMSLTKFSKDEL